MPEPGNENIEKWLEERIKGYSELTLSDLKNGPVLAPGLQQIAYSDMKFMTPSGKIELYSLEAQSKWGISPLPSFNKIEIDSDDSRYPLNFITPNAAGTIHSQFGNLKIIKANVPEPAAEISPADAKDRKIFNGDRIRIFNRHGRDKDLQQEYPTEFHTGSLFCQTEYGLEKGEAEIF